MFDSEDIYRYLNVRSQTGEYSTKIYLLCLIALHIMQI